MQQQRRRPPVPASPVALNNNSNRPIRQTNRSMPMTVNQCFGCSQPMYNALLSNVLDRLWHPDCVRCFVCRCILNEQCYSREGKLYCKDDFIKKYIHRCFACQNLIQSHELIRRVRAGRIYHADCFVCIKCKRILQDDDITSLISSDGSTLNDMNYLCQACSNSTNKLVKSSIGTTSSSNADEDETTDSEVSNTTNGKMSSIDKQVSTTINTHTSQTSNTPILSSIEQLSLQSTTSVTNNQVNEPQPMPVDEILIHKSSIPSAKTHSSSSISSATAPSETLDETVTPPPTTTATTKSTGRKTKSRQNSSNNSNKRSPVKSKVTTSASRQKQTTVNERKGRSPATRSKSSTAASATVQTRSSNRRNTKTSRYRKQSFSSGSDEDETEEDDDEDEDENEDDDTDFSDEDEMQGDEGENSPSSANKTKSSKNASEKKTESESTITAIPPAPPSVITSVPTQPKISEPLSLLSGLSTNPISVSSIMKSDISASFMPPNFNPAFPTPQPFLPQNHPFPSGFPLQPRLPMPPPPGISQPQPAPIPDTYRSSHSTNVSETDSLDRSSSPSQMDTSTSAESVIPVRQATTPLTTTQKPSALSSLLEFGALPPSSLGDIRPTGTSTNPFPFPFVTPGPGIPFSPQAAAGMTTYYRPPFGVPPATASLDITQQSSSTVGAASAPAPAPKSTSTQSKKKSTAKTNSMDVVSQNILDEPSSPKKKARTSNPRSKGKAKKNETDGENDADEDNVTSLQTNKKKKKTKKDTKDNTVTNDTSETKVSNGTTSNVSHNLLTQMGLMNNSFMQPTPPPPLQSSSSTNGTTPTPTPNAQQQQAQIAAMYNMAPHFAAYNTFPGAFNPAFAGAGFPGGYPPPYGFHPAFGSPPTGQPFPFMSSTPTSTASSMNNTSSPAPITTTSSSTDDKPASTVTSETRPPKSRNKSNTGGEKKKPATPRSSKKKAALAAAPTVTTGNNETTTVPIVSPTEATAKVTTTPESTSTPPPTATKRRISGTESEDFDEKNDEQQQQSQTTNGKSGNESDGSIGAADRSLNVGQSTSTSSSTALEKKGGRTTIKPQQLEILNKAFESCSKPNKTQREQLATDTGLTLRVIQVWFQNKRSKERKGKISKEKETPLDDDDGGEDSQPLSPQPPLPPLESTQESIVESTPVTTNET